ncbi:MAG TPA: hypothetical protein VGP88_08450 [Thermoplasmata archaeon]|nr:hypothetical protein [Thermoplasmata archaeon]
MADVPPPSAAPRRVPGLAPGLEAAVLAVLRSSPKPLRRREILADLERSGHRVSLAGLNRVLQQCAEAGTTEERPEGVRIRGPGR